jgi:hypothetical protein
MLVRKVLSNSLQMYLHFSRFICVNPDIDSINCVTVTQPTLVHVLLICIPYLHKFRFIH